MRKRFFADDLEKRVAEALDSRRIGFTHESEGGVPQLDFYLPKYEIHIEVKKFHTIRSDKQLRLFDNVILIQGEKSVRFLESILNNLPK